MICAGGLKGLGLVDGSGSYDKQEVFVLLHCPLKSLKANKTLPKHMETKAGP